MDLFWSQGAVVADSPFRAPFEPVRVAEGSGKFSTDMEDDIDGQVKSASCQTREEFSQIGARNVLVNQEVDIVVTACIEGLSDRGVVERGRADVFAQQQGWW